MKEFAGKVAVITGAGSGLGRELAILGAGLGMKLVLADVQPDALDGVTAELFRQGADVLSVVCDVRRSCDVQAVADAALTRHGRVHLLLNNAGVATGGLVWEASEQDWEWTLGVNLWGAIHGLRIFVPRMLEWSRFDPHYEGHIVNTASIAGLLNAPNMAVYNVSKHAVVSLSESLHHDLQLVGAPIGTSVLCPSFVRTGIHQAERNRPEELKNPGHPTGSQLASRLLMDKAVNAGEASAAQVARCTFDAIRDNRFYIFPSPAALSDVEIRMHDILQQRTPADPYAKAPRIRHLLQARLKR